MDKIKYLENKIKSKEEHILNLKRQFGRMFQNFVPFIKNFPGDKDRTIFLGKPIDFISFDNDAIKFIEIKTNDSFLSENQLRIKKQIEQGKIEFKEVRY